MIYYSVVKAALVEEVTRKLAAAKLIIGARRRCQGSGCQRCIISQLFVRMLPDLRASSRSISSRKFLGEIVYITAPYSAKRN